MNREHRLEEEEKCEGRSTEVRKYGWGSREKFVGLRLRSRSRFGKCSKRMRIEIEIEEEFRFHIRG